MVKQEILKRECIELDQEKKISKKYGKGSRGIDRRNVCFEEHIEYLLLTKKFHK